jgi:hypothetical protein
MTPVKKIPINVEALAEMVYEQNRLYSKQLGEDNATPWAEASDAAKTGIITAVQDFLNADQMPNPERQHDQWMESKLKDGWTYGPVVDAEKKQHPYLLPWHAMTEAQRYKDYLFCSLLALFWQAKRLENSRAMQREHSMIATPHPSPIQNAIPRR